MNRRQVATDTDYEEVDERAEESTDEDGVGLPARLEDLNIYRHPLKKGQSNDSIISVCEELEIDRELGLTRQAEKTASKALKQDIDELTSSEDYYQVTTKLLEKLFQINKLRGKCLVNNILAPTRGLLIAGILPIMLHLLTVATTYPMIKFTMWLYPTVSKSPSALLVSLIVVNLAAWVGWVIMLVHGVTKWGGKRLSYSIWSVGLKSSPLSQVSDTIPRGAKLKVLEAKKTGIFADFVYITPEFKVESVNKLISPVFPAVVDPAILGVTADKRMFMIVYWDIQKDVEKVVKQIEHFKKFKLNKHATA